ncbi:MAG TPA: hypothetical protein VK513_18485 [Terriglobales bacterium]|nr:hypothetical protein [Terriglobales bacterium]
MSSPTGVVAAVADPPVPNQVTRISPPSTDVKARDNFNRGIMATVLVAAAAICFWTKHSVAGYILGGLGLVLIISLVTKKSDVGQCP